jgi:hypothetical protein
MPTDLQLKAMNTIHRALLKISGGRFGWRVGGMASLELTTTGRKSGRPHSVMLTSPVQEGDLHVGMVTQVEKPCGPGSPPQKNGRHCGPG